MSNRFDRRTFLRFCGLGAGATVLPACTDAPVQKIYAYLTPPEEIVPGVATWYASLCRDCPAGCGLTVRTREGRPVKLEGNPKCPVDRGALCLRGQSAIQGLYDPDRFQTSRLGSPGQTSAGAPDQVVAAIGRGLAQAERAGSDRVLLTTAQSGSSAWFYQQLAERLGARWLAFEPLAHPALKSASAQLFGRAVVPRFDLSRADLILNFGADLIESWQSPVEHARQLAAVHGFDGQRPAVHVVIAPRRDLTAAKADRWISVRPGFQGALALALAGRLLPGSDLPDEEKARIGAWLSPYELTAVASQAGCDAAILERLAGQLAQAQTPLALPAQETLLGAGATFDQAAVLLLDHVLGAGAEALRFEESNPWNDIAPASALDELFAQAEAGQVGALILVGANPAYHWPDEGRVKKALARIPLVAQIATGPNESSDLAGAILPASHFLESWGDAQVRPDWIGLQQPVARPRGQQRQAEDWLIAISAAAGAALPWADFRQCLAQRWAWIQQQVAPGKNESAFFRSALADGGLSLDKPLPATPRGGEAQTPPDDATRPDAPAPQDAAAPTPTGPRALVATELPPPVSPRPADQPWLLIYPSGRLYDGRTARRPWIQECPDSLTQTVWDTPAEISPRLAARLGLASGDKAKLKTASGEVLATVRVLPGARDDVVALPLGGGRREAGRTASGLGVRAQALLSPKLDLIGGGLAWMQQQVSLERQGEGILTTVEGEPYTHGRPLAPSVSLQDALAGRFPRQTLHGQILIDIKTGQPVPEAEGHGPTQLKKPEKRKAGVRPKGSFYEAHEFPEHMWGLTVDLDRCNGCGACVVACQAENNVPTVGPEEVQRGREMHWIRIERYWTEAAQGQEKNGPRPRFLPVMCQHCEKAPCEPVCPVFASYHTRDGLNAQIYNRCVGTRYCANNCPYKVRRFNWFDNKWAPPLEQQLNPDVTVRTAGVMEKCTLCVQRIREKANLARAEGRPVREDEILPACAQTCPAGALVFGDRQDEASRVAARAKDPRAYKLLDYYLDSKPAITYLCQVDRPGVDGEG